MFLARLLSLILLCWGASLQGEALKVAIFAFKIEGQTPWDPDSVETGITGSEEAIIYMGQELAQLGYRVTVFANPPKDSRHSVETANPRFVPAEFPDQTYYDIGVLWRLPQHAPFFKKRTKRLYFWPHDVFKEIVEPLPDSVVSCYEGVFWLSEWQRQVWVSQTPALSRHTKIYGNGIVPHQFSDIRERPNPYACIYGSNYGRGLEVLLEIWPTVKKLFPKATLDIYYGWKHWGLLTPEKEARLKEQIAKAASLGVTDHGLVGHKELNEAYAKASFWTYPCTTDDETFCITALRAQFAGAIPVIVCRAALKETVQKGYACASSEAYLATLMQAMQQAEKISLKEREELRRGVGSRFTWREIARSWKTTFDNH